MAKATTSAAQEFPGHNNLTSNDQAAGGNPTPLPTGELSTFDLSRFRVPQEHFADTTAPKLLTTIRVGKPSKEPFFRTHPDPAYSIVVGLVTRETSDNNVFLVEGDLTDALSKESTFSQKLLMTCVTRSGTVFLWPLGLDATNSWISSARKAAAIARTTWIRIKSNQEDKGYDVIPAMDQSPEPAWPTKSFPELMHIAFQGRIIDSLDHPVMRDLRGE